MSKDRAPELGGNSEEQQPISPPTERGSERIRNRIAFGLSMVMFYSIGISQAVAFAVYGNSPEDSSQFTSVLQLGIIVATAAGAASHIISRSPYQ